MREAETRWNQHQTQALALEMHTGEKQMILQILKHRHCVWCAGAALGLRHVCHSFSHSRHIFCIFVSV